MRRLEQLKIRNFRSIREQTLELGPLNVFIGGNGAGKSNLVQVFRFLKEISLGHLQQYSQTKGADALLHFGRKKSPNMEFELGFSDSDSRLENLYQIELVPTDQDTLLIRQEKTGFWDRSRFPRPYTDLIALDARESALENSRQAVAVHVRNDLKSYRVYHFHDTSDQAAVKGVCSVEDNRFLREDASNLAAFLYYLQQRKPRTVENIVATLQQIAPFFEEFQLAPSRLNPEKIRLEWREKGSESYFNANSLSDGTLRFICLATLLMQPELPRLVLLDEPELGLHPAAIVLLADLLRSASQRTQLIVATQSVGLVNQLSHEQVWTVDREDGQSIFHHLAQDDLGSWLEGYALGELWEMNRLGARP
jgi:predicted ATPase